jgi:hypothetical protein
MFNLASSFRLRNKLKERIAGLSNAIESAEFGKNAGTEENTSPCDGKTLTEAIAEVNALMELLRELNSKIEKANTVNRDSLINMETLKAKIAFYGRVAQKCRHSKKYEFEYDEEGERVKVAKEPLVDQAQVTAVLASLKKEKDALEEKITAVNFNAAVDFDPETILKRL